MKTLSVVICTHNPRPDYLERVLAALQVQTLALSQWELVLVDNQSEPPLAEHFDLRWHPASRIVLEDRLGLTRARLRGITESTGPLLVYVDDDNVLAPDYLATALGVAEKHAFLGVWSGQVLPEFEIPPPPALEPWWLDFLGAQRPIKREIWGNSTDANLLPYGAGMCVRRAVAERYVRDLEANPARITLDRTGELLYGAGDLDLGMTAVDMGLGTGLFPGLKVIHLIPRCRFNEAYLLKLARDEEISNVVFNHVWGLNPNAPQCRADRLLATYKLWRSSALERRITQAMREGKKLGKLLLASLQGGDGPPSVTRYG